MTLDAEPPIDWPEFEARRRVAHAVRLELATIITSAAAFAKNPPTIPEVEARILAALKSRSELRRMTTRTW